MKCQNCALDIKEQFKHAIESNKCPACGLSIINGDPGIYAKLFSVLNDHIKSEDIDIETVATKIMSEVINTMVKESVKKEVSNSLRKVKANQDSEPVVDDDGILYSHLDTADYKKVLQKMRADALSDTISDNRIGKDIGLGGIETQTQSNIIDEQNNKRNAILTGASGSFSRS